MRFCTFIALSGIYIGSVASGVAQTALVESSGEPLAVHADFREEAGNLGTLQWSKKISKIGACLS